MNQNNVSARIVDSLIVAAALLAAVSTWLRLKDLPDDQQRTQLIMTLATSVFGLSRRRPSRTDAVPAGKGKRSAFRLPPWLLVALAVVQLYRTYQAARQLGNR